MISDKMKKLVENNSVIREMFEEGKRLRAIYGDKNVFDFSLGNPSVETPEKVNEAIKEILEKEDSLKVHGYMSNSGFEDVRTTIADSINKRFETNFSENNIIMTVGAASALNIIFKSILNPDDEVIVFAPYFMEYNNYVSGYDGKVVVVSPNTENFEPNLEEFESKITEKTKAVLVNTPNNPTGVIYKEDVIKKMTEIMNRKEQEFGHEIFLISDEPYRELVYDDIEVPYLTKYYNNTFIVYSYSKTLSLPGERIGYVVVPSEMEDAENIITAITISNRIIGCVNAPSLIQRTVMKCINEKVDISIYKKNRDLLYSKLTELGFECIKPEGAFYLFVKTPVDDKEFCDKAKEFNLLFVPGSSFGCSGYVRIAYCVKTDMIERSFEAFRKLAEYYKK